MTVRAGAVSLSSEHVSEGFSRLYSWWHCFLGVISSCIRADRELDSSVLAWLSRSASCLQVECDQLPSVLDADFPTSINWSLISEME